MNARNIIAFTKANIENYLFSVQYTALQGKALLYHLSNSDYKALYRQNVLSMS